MSFELEVYKIGLNNRESVGNKLDMLLWFINHCNMPLSNDYLTSAGVCKLLTPTEVKFRVVVSYKETIVISKDYPHPIDLYLRSPKQINDQIEERIYYEIMNNLLLWTGPDSVREIIIKFRNEHEFLPADNVSELCKTLIEQELSKIRN